MIDMTSRTTLILTAVLPLLACGGQDNSHRASPHETVSVDLKGDRISISYGRPYVKGRKIGDQFAPFGQVWRLGADEATKLTVTAKTRIGDALDLDPGSYSLFAIPAQGKWTIIVNKVANQWGAFSYKESEDAGRFDVPVKPSSSPVEQFTIRLTKLSENTADLILAWGDTSVTTTLKTL